MEHWVANFETPLRTGDEQRVQIKFQTLRRTVQGPRRQDGYDYKLPPACQWTGLWFQFDHDSNTQELYG